MSTVQDVYFAYALLGVIVVTGLGYAVRVVISPMADSERAQRIGGTWLVGKPLMNWTYWAIDPVARGFARLGISANVLTWASLVLGLCAGGALATGWFGLACLLATLSTIGDIFDGQVARLTETGSDRGELLDAAVDRYTEYAFTGGLIVYFRDALPLLLLALAALLACVMVSYVSAKAEALQVAAPRGLMRRHERAAYLIIGAGLTSLIGPRIAAIWPALPRTTPELLGLALVAAIGNFAAVTRLVRIGRALTP